MIRFRLIACSILLGSLIGPPIAIGQEPTKEGPPARKPAGPADSSVDGPAKGNPYDQQMHSYFSLYQNQLQQATAVTNVADPLEANFGLTLADADDTLRAQLEIPRGNGVVVVGVKAGSLAEHAGLKTNDVLLSLGGQPTKDGQQVRDILLKLGKEALEVKLIREGKPSRMSLVGPEHGFPPEAAEYWIGVPVSPVDATLRVHLPTLPADSGLVANDVVKGSPADLVAVKKDDVLVAMDGKPLKNSDVLIAQIKASGGKPVPLEILRAGKPLSISITPARRSHPTVINVVNFKGNPELQRLFQVVRPNLAIEDFPNVHYTTPANRGKAAESKAASQGTFTLYAPYSGIVVDPYAGVPANTPNFIRPLNQIPLNPSFAIAEPSTARIEGQLKEVIAKLDEITRALEGLKKAAGK